MHGNAFATPVGEQSVGTIDDRGSGETLRLSALASPRQPLPVIVGLTSRAWKAGMPSLRILIADDHEIVRHGLRAVLAANRNWEVCGEAWDSAAAYTLAMQTKPDIVVLDLSMPGAA